VFSKAGYSLLGATMFLLFIGAITVFSSSSKLVLDDSGAVITSRLSSHSLRILVGIIVMILASRIPYDSTRILAGWLFLFGILLLTAVLILPVEWGLVELVYNSRRRLRIPFFPMPVQPAEFMKLAVTFYLASYLARNPVRIKKFREGLLQPLLLVCLVAMLVVFEPDLSTTVCLVLIAGVLLASGGARFRHILGIAALLIPAAALLIKLYPYRMSRVMIFTGTWSGKVDFLKSRMDEGYQIFHSLVAVGSGGLTGVGSGCSMQRFFLPQPFTDFIFSIISEELGLAGSLAVLGLFVVVAWAGFRIALAARDRYGFLVAVGLTAGIIINASLHVAVCLSLVPVTGLTLPFVSFGGSSLLFSLAAVGILLNIDRSSGVALLRPAVPFDERHEKIRSAAEKRKNV